ncbi:uncharacterized protein LOC132617345 [Lycium barbarum]|uniref:uncharacterized protein LOC132617345 n=1 Tax=Lycium barbarum TaxID=112863 RepID=UPI00293E0B53|nr:uncharacterized protein LOC132617345 [Lycium barbarum]
MADFIYVTLKWFYGGVFDLSSGVSRYEGGNCTEFLDVDVDRLSYFELRDYIKELGYSPSCGFKVKPPNSDILVDVLTDKDILDLSLSLKDGDIVEIYVCHMVDEPDMPPLPLEYIVPNNQTKSDAFNKVGEGIQCEPNVCQSNPNENPTTKNTPLETVATTTSPSQFPTNSSTPQTEAVENSPKQTEPEDGENAKQVSSDHVDSQSTDSDVESDLESDVESDHVAVFDGPDGDDGSDVHEESVNEFRDAVTRYSLQKHIQLDKFVNEPSRVRVTCRDGCPWLIYAKLDNSIKNFQIKTYYPKHRCVQTTRNYMCNSKYLATHYKDRITEQPNIRICKLQEAIRKELGVHVGRSTVRRVKSKVLLEIMGDQEKKFGRILDYRDEVLRTNPGSTCVVKVSTTEFAEDGRPCFLGFYICFDALKRSFLSGFRRCIGLDGCFLKGCSKGQLLVVVAKDGNNQILPIAWAVVECENKTTWAWFFKILIEDLNLGDGTGYTVISDMQKGLFATIKELLPEVEQRQCARHILANWSKDWGGLERRLIFWKCARSTIEVDLRRNLDKLQLLGGEKIVEDLLYYKEHTFCKVYFNTETKCDIINNNMAESFNAWILPARHKTIITMLEEIRIKVMNRISVMGSFANTWVTRISPMALRTLEENMGKSMNCDIVFNGEHGFEILDGLYQHTVDIVNEKCSCRSWQLKGIPCPHAICAMLYKKYEPIEYVHEYYSKKNWFKTYCHYIQPMTNMAMWPRSANPAIAPPIIRKMPGRPSKARRK